MQQDFDQETCLFDRNATEYTASLHGNGARADVSIIWKHSWVGRIQWFVDDDNVLQLGNIEIFENPILPRNGLFSLHPFQRPKKNFRQLGLGSAMLGYVIAQAEQLQVKGISGFITAKDAIETPYLFDFYRNHGFVVHMTTDHPSDTAATIYREVG